MEPLRKFRSRDPLLTPAQAARETGLPVGTIRHYLDAGIIPYVTVAGAARQTRYIRLSELEKRLQEVVAARKEARHG